MARKPTKPLVFIDTNILLDFYRFRQSDLNLKLLKSIDEHHDSIITSAQVAMEFKKNRQKVILDTLGKVASGANQGTFSPAFLADTSLVKGMIKSNEQIQKRHRILKEKIKTVLKEPTTHDKVYQTCQRLFSNKSEFNLHRDAKIRFEIRRLARKRFILGYPPRKDGDTSIGDAINWEWIIHSSAVSGRDIILVSRDSDYGVTVDQEAYLNDWLRQEFKERVSLKRQIILTSRLTAAFKQLAVHISKDEEKQETEAIEQVERKETRISGDKFIAQLLGAFTTPLALREDNKFNVDLKIGQVERG